jgi:hypothetical protein
VADSFIGGGNQRIQRKPQTCKSLKNFIYNIVWSTTHHEWDFNSQRKIGKKEGGNK